MRHDVRVLGTFQHPDPITLSIPFGPGFPADCITILVMLRGYMKEDAVGSVQQSYKTEAHTRVGFGADAKSAAHSYAPFVTFVEFVAPPRPFSSPPSLLDVGCGCGWTSYCLANAGYNTTGIDLNTRGFEPPPTAGLDFVEGNALALPFADSSFDVVTSLQCVEHLPDPELALREMLRVLRPGGTVIIVGPNLLSPVLPFKFLLREILYGKLIWRRTPTTPFHPYGNTVSEVLRSSFTVSARLLHKLFNGKPDFLMRTPDSVPPFYADNDACYLCNPTDLMRFFAVNGLRTVKNGKKGRPAWTALFAGGTWVAASKPGN